MIDFPDTPSVGDYHTEGNKRWQCVFAGAVNRWKRVPADAAPLAVKTWVPDYASLSSAGLSSGDMVWVQQDDMFYPWNGTAFPAQWEGVSVSGFKTKTKMKPSDTTRASTIVDVIDPDLQISVPAGLYHVEVHAYLDMASGTTANFHVQVMADNGVGTGYTNGNGRRRYAVANVTGVDSETYNSAGVNGGSTGITSATSMPGAYGFDGVITMLTPGKIGLFWSQGSSSATGSIVKKGSFLRVTKL